MSSEYFKNSFRGGINRFDEPTAIAADEYFILSNGRTRDGGIVPTTNPIEDTGIPVGKKQGLYGAGNFLLCMVAGSTYYKNLLDDAPTWKKINGIILDDEVEYIYAIPVPASTINFSRQMTSEDKRSEVQLVSKTSQSPVSIILQDGINQGKLIFPNASARDAHTYLEWTVDDREYLPIGTLMLINDSITYLIARDSRDTSNGAYNQIFRSVSGRPVDFMVNIQQDGDREVSEENGGAQTVSYRVSYDDITSISRINETNNGFTIGTNNASYLVIPDKDNKIFGEPTFNNRFLFSTSPLNQFSSVDILGDTAFVDTYGIKSYNSVEATQVEGNNTPFYKRIASMFVDNSLKIIRQTIACSTNFNDYAFFAVNTKYGFGVMVYDTLTAPVDEKEKGFVSFDQFEGVEAIKQFATVKYRSINRMFCITDNNKLFEMYPENGDTAEVKVYPGEFTSQNPSQEQRATLVHLQFTQVEESEGTATVSLYSDRRLVGVQSKDIGDAQTSSSPEPIPFTEQIDNNVRTLTYNFSNLALVGFQCGCHITWGKKAKLLAIRIESEIESKDTAFRQQAIVYDSVR